jgi:hypothetical protein
MSWKQLPVDHPSMTEILRVARTSFKTMMNSCGFGRVDMRIDSQTGRVVFLEINPNCGILYEIGQESSADFILDLCQERQAFIKLQITEAIRQNNTEKRQKAFSICLDGSRPNIGWTTRATRNISKGEVVLDLQQKQRYTTSNSHIIGDRPFPYADNNKSEITNVSFLDAELKYITLIDILAGDELLM